MSHSSEPGPAARRPATALGLLAVVLLAVVGGVFVMATTSGAASAWVDPPIEAPIVDAEEARPTTSVRAPRPVGRRTREQAMVAGATTVFWPRRAAATLARAPEDPPPGRSPPAR